MIKECKVILRNDIYTVADYDGVQVQFPSIDKVDKFIYIELKNSKYSVVSKDVYEKSLVKINKPKKKEVINDIVEEFSKETK